MSNSYTEVKIVQEDNKHTFFWTRRFLELVRRVRLLEVSDFFFVDRRTFFLVTVVRFVLFDLGCLPVETKRRFFRGLRTRHLRFPDVCGCLVRGTKEKTNRKEGRKKKTKRKTRTHV